MGSLFKSAPKAPKPPEIKPPAALPDEDVLKKSRKRSAIAQSERSGRTSTILSQGETLG